MTVDSLRARHRDSEVGERSQFVLSLYTADFRQSATSSVDHEVTAEEDDVTPIEAVSLCVDPTDTAVATVWGFEDEGQADFDGGDPVILGLTTTLGGPGVVEVADGAMTARFRVDHDLTDADGDTYQRRRLENGTEHEVLKNFPSEGELIQRVSRLGWGAQVDLLEHYWLLSWWAPK